MTPDDLKHYVDQALSNRHQWALIYWILVPVISIGGSWLISYLKEKGKNAATKEDVGEITRKIESSKSFYGERLEQLKTELAARSHYSKVRYEREMEIFKEVSPKLHALRVAVAGLRPPQDPRLSPGQTQEERNRERLKLFNSAHFEFMQTIEINRPFYPPEIWKELMALRNLCWIEATEFSLFDPKSQQDYWVQAYENTDAIEKQVVKVYDAMRTRLTEFDRL
jgi:hypothetical protein